MEGQSDFMSSGKRKDLRTSNFQFRHSTETGRRSLILRTIQFDSTDLIDIMLTKLSKDFQSLGEECSEFVHCVTLVCVFV